MLTVDETSLTASWEPPLPDERNGVISSYTLNCTGGSEILELRLNPISTITLYDLRPNTQYMCEVAASTSAGIGPFTNQISITTEGIYSHNKKYMVFNFSFNFRERE